LAPSEVVAKVSRPPMLPSLAEIELPTIYQDRAIIPITKPILIWISRERRGRWIPLPFHCQGAFTATKFGCDEARYSETKPLINNALLIAERVFLGPQKMFSAVDSGIDASSWCHRRAV